MSPQQKIRYLKRQLRQAEAELREAELREGITKETVAVALYDLRHDSVDGTTASEIAVHVGAKSYHDNYRAVVRKVNKILRSHKGLFRLTDEYSRPLRWKNTLDGMDVGREHSTAKTPGDAYLSLPTWSKRPPFKKD